MAPPLVRRLDFWLGLATLLLGCAIVWYARVRAAALPPASGASGAWFFPAVAGGALAIFSLLMLVGQVTAPLRVAADAEGEGVLHPVAPVAALLLVVYALAVQAFGFLIPTPLSLAAAMWLWGYRRPWPLGVCALATTAGLYFFFTRLAGVSLNAWPE